MHQIKTAWFNDSKEEKEVTGQEIKRLRLEHHFSQKELGNQSFSAAYISRVERGRQKPSKKFLDHVSTMRSYRPHKYRDLERNDHLVDVLLHLASSLLELNQLEVASMVAKHALLQASHSGNIQIIAGMLQISLAVHTEQTVAIPQKIRHIMVTADFSKSPLNDILQLLNP